MEIDDGIHQCSAGSGGPHGDLVSGVPKRKYVAGAACGRARSKGESLLHWPWGLLLIWTEPALGAGSEWDPPSTLPLAHSKGAREDPSD